MYTISVELEDGQSLAAKVDGRDIRRWEAQNGKSFIGEPFSYTMLTELARLSLVRTKVLNMSAQEFDEKCVDVSELAADEPADPTSEAPTDGASSS